MIAYFFILKVYTRRSGPLVKLGRVGNLIGFVIYRRTTTFLPLFILSVENPLLERCVFP